MLKNRQEFAHVNILCQFFEIAVHNILYVRKIYPETIFVRRRKYGVVIHQSIHPKLNEYISDCLKSVEYHTKNNQLSKLFICLSSSRVVFEKYVFDVLNLTSNFDNDSFFVKLEQSLRTFCLKLHTSHTFLKPVPADTIFSIQLLTTEYSNATFNNDPSFADFPWIQINQKETAIQSSDIVPLHTIDTDNIKIQIYVEKKQCQC